ncbi:MAG: hypothetical protein AMJ93_08895 [Anaerolineae bacterium SM23_84]|nr:MAG: hypothetical protein AMJ93_08895 [Anaerolineae bacterium SM23_84]
MACITTWNSAATHSQAMSDRIPVPTKLRSWLHKVRRQGNKGDDQDEQENDGQRVHNAFYRNRGECAHYAQALKLRTEIGAKQISQPNGGNQVDQIANVQ